MTYDVPTINYVLSLGTVGLEIVTLALLAVFFLQRKFPDLRDIGNFVEQWGLWIGFGISVPGLFTTLFYSEVLGFAPCGLCWLQRVFLYPQVVLFGIAAWKKDKSVALYSIVLSAFGAIVALYNHYLQMGGTDVIPCPASVGIASDCAQRFLFEFGYMTFPFMSFSIFAFLIAVMLLVRRSTRA